jgi:hypothetical protein
MIIHQVKRLTNKEHTSFKSLGARLLVATIIVPLLNNLLRIPDKATIANTSTV